MEKKRNQKKITLATVSQSLFITIKLFAANKMPSYAEACSFGLLFSFVPIFMITLIVIVRILHASPEILASLLGSLFQAVPQLEVLFSPEKIFAMFSRTRMGGFFEVFIALFAFWMSRRFLVSIFQSFKSIFHTQHERKSFTAQLLMFATVTLIIFAFTALVFAYITVQSVTGSSLFQAATGKFPQLTIFNHFLSRFFIKVFPNILILIVVTVLYKIVPGTKPNLRLCIAFGLFCTVSFWGFRTVVHFFLNAKSYNALYGVLGQVIILLMDIFFFFAFFLFCAEFIFVCQFFDDLLIGELYLLPKREEKSKASSLRRALFIRPDFLLAKEGYTVALRSGDTIFEKGELNDEAYFIAEGTVQSVKADGCTLFEKGDFFGEISCTLKKPHDSTARAVTDAKIVRIKGETFRFLVEQDSEVARKTLSQFSEYFSDYYGKTEFDLAYDF